MTLYHHHEPAGVCGVCDEFAFAHATFWLSAADIMAQRAHWQACEVARDCLARAHAQLESQRDSPSPLALAQSWMARSMGVVISAMSEEVVSG